MPHTARIASLARSIATLVVLATVIAIVLSGSCLFDTTTNLCESFNWRCPPGEECAAKQAACIRIGTCGNAVQAGDEVCDDGNIIDGDGCSANCDSTEQCGNRIPDLPVGEECDDGNKVNGDGCSDACRVEVCGNGVRNPGEVCDDQNMVSGDGCSFDCLSNEACGNNVVDMHLGEECEFEDAPFPLRFDDIAACDNDCTFPRCGDGHTNVLFTVTGMGGDHVEQCDSGELGSPSCDPDCTFVQCGDGYPNKDAGEFCDNGGPIDRADCDSDCTAPSCGDQYTNRQFNPPGPANAEECDTGGNTAACDSDCTRPRCGDGHFNPQAETCETVGNAGCTDPEAPDCDGCTRCT